MNARAQQRAFYVPGPLGPDALADALRAVHVQLFIGLGNHDVYSALYDADRVEQTGYLMAEFEQIARAVLAALSGIGALETRVRCGRSRSGRRRTRIRHWHGLSVRRSHRSARRIGPRSNCRGPSSAGPTALKAGGTVSILKRPEVVEIGAERPCASWKFHNRSDGQTSGGSAGTSEPAGGSGGGGRGK